MKQCEKCKKMFPEFKNQLDSSHDIPQYIGGLDSDGMSILCKKCHRQYDLFLLVEFLKHYNEYPILNNWLDVAKEMQQIKKNTNLHPSLRVISKCCYKIFFQDENDFYLDESFFCINCKRKIDIEWFFNNWCNYCNTLQNNNMEDF